MRTRWHLPVVGLITLALAVAWRVSDRFSRADVSPVTEEVADDTGLSVRPLPITDHSSSNPQSEVLEPARALEVRSRLAQIDAVEARAGRGDEAALSQLGALLGLCSRLLGGESADRRATRFQAPAWRMWADACSSQRQVSWAALLRSAAVPRSTDVQTLAAFPTDSSVAEQLERRDRILEGILANTSDAEVGATAAYIYLDRKRQLAWAVGEIPNSLLSPEGSESLRMDAAIALACKMSRDCSPYSPHILAECAATAGCLPGAGMEQILVMRRSPQDLHLIGVLVDRLLAIRNSARDR